MVNQSRQARVAIRYLAIGALLLCIPAQEVFASEPWAFTAPIRRRVQADFDTAPLIDRASKLYTQAQQAFFSNQLAEAQTFIQQADAVAPGSPLILGLAGRIYNNTGSYGLALEAWNALLDQFPGNPVFLAERAGTLFLLKRNDDAQKDIRRATRTAPADLTVRYFQLMAAIHDNDTAAARRVSASLTNPEILEIAKRLYLERNIIPAMSRENGFAEFARALFALPDSANADTAVPEIIAQLTALIEPMGQSNWAAAIPHLQKIRATGAAYPSLYYDLALCAYLVAPSDKRLDDLEKFVSGENGRAFARYFIYLCLYGGDFTRAKRTLDTTLQDAEDEEITLIRAAIAYENPESDEAWQILEKIPLALRPATEDWFARNIPVIRALKSNPNLQRWLAGEPIHAITR